MDKEPTTLDAIQALIEPLLPAASMLYENKLYSSSPCFCGGLSGLLGLDLQVFSPNPECITQSNGYKAVGFFNAAPKAILTIAEELRRRT